MYNRVVKRILDILFSLIGIAFGIIPMLLISAVIMIDSKGGAVFCQTRSGRNKKPFKIIKFRTMKKDAPHEIPTKDLDHPEEWETRAGAVLRKTSLDELPQLFNILLGDMSFVGPRPVVPAESALIEEREKYGANDIRPGLTGLAQINGRDMLSDEEKARLDGIYVRTLSFSTDLKCCIKTIRKVINQSDVRA